MDEKTRHIEKNIPETFQVLFSAYPIFQTRLHEITLLQIVEFGFRRNGESVKRRIKIQLVAQRKQRRGLKRRARNEDSSLMKLRRSRIIDRSCRNTTTKSHLND